MSLNAISPLHLRSRAYASRDISIRERYLDFQDERLEHLTGIKRPEKIKERGNERQVAAIKRAAKGSTGAIRKIFLNWNASDAGRDSSSSRRKR
jgi:hypothetical protein